VVAPVVGRERGHRVGALEVGQIFVVGAAG
jgi:hypothetical protein